MKPSPSKTPHRAEAANLKSTSVLMKSPTMMDTTLTQDMLTYENTARNMDQQAKNTWNVESGKNIYQPYHRLRIKRLCFSTLQRLSPALVSRSGRNIRYLHG